MARSRAGRKLAWFAQGVAAYQRSRPGAQPVYPCPLCIRGFADPGALTFEDVPPKAIGGRPLLLTCSECNHTSGHSLDTHIRSGRDLKEIAEGRREARIKLTQFGQTVSALATFGSDTISVAAQPEHSDPRAHKALVDQLEAAVATGSTDWTAELTMTIRHDPQREEVAWLRVAYLYACAALGVQFFLRPELEPIREQIRSPDERLVPQSMKHTEPGASSDGISFVYSPRDLQCILVRLGRRLLLFPNFEGASEFYGRPALKGPRPPFTLQGVHLPLPKKPVFLFDENPGAVWLTVPPEDRARRRLRSARVGG